MTGSIDIPALVKRLCQRPREMEWLEFKTSHIQPEKLGQNISALANAVALAGKPYGYMVWGVHDDNHQVIGTKFNPDLKKVNGACQ